MFEITHMNMLVVFLLKLFEMIYEKDNINNVAKKSHEKIRSLGLSVHTHIKKKKIYISKTNHLFHV